jgi:ribosomal protein S12 methylthiotransferase
MNKTVGVISLGCDKNRVDTENILYFLRAGGFTLTPEPDGAEVIVVNTCAFIKSARREAIETILETARLKTTGALKYLIVGGCMLARHLPDLKAGLPEVDAFVAPNEYPNICAVIAELYGGKISDGTGFGINADGGGSLIKDGGKISDGKLAARDSISKDTAGNGQNPAEITDRILSTPQHYAYLRIAEGCDNRCTYCTIPIIKGAYKSRSFGGLVTEAEKLIGGGVKELILVAQDTTRYGGEPDSKGLIRLAERLCKIDGLRTLRLMYCYPENVSGDLIRFAADNEKVAKYFDIPMQHIADGVLKRMGRKTDGAHIRRLIDAIRGQGDFAIRSTFIVGFPGETDADFAELTAFLSGYNLDNAGFFAYSREDGTAAAKLPGQLTQSVKRKRLNAAAAVQKAVVIAKNRARVGRTLRVIYEGADYGRGKFIGRTDGNAPAVDSLVYFDAAWVDIGNYYDVKITGFDGYDLLGKKVDE